MDGALRLSQHPTMLTHDEIREELIRRLNDGLKATKVARMLNISPERVSEMKARRRRVSRLLSGFYWPFFHSCWQPAILKMEFEPFLPRSQAFCGRSQIIQKTSMIRRRSRRCFAD